MSKTARRQSISEDDTPMMQQYLRIKGAYPDAILFFRMGDFYEMFLEDAQTASGILEIALTSRNKNKGNPIPMCGVPHHSASLYIAKLIKAGKTIALCEQVEDPRQAKGLVKREVVRVITPGTVLEDNLLDPKSHHFLVSVYFGEKGTGLAALDVSTGLFRVTQLPAESPPALLEDELAKLEPKELICPESSLNGNSPFPASWKHGAFLLQGREDWTFHHAQARRCLLDHFKTRSLEGFGCETLPHAVSAAGGLLHYLQDTQKTHLKHITRLSTFHLQETMQLDEATITSLELVRSSEGDRKQSLLGLLDDARTPMGSRRIREWILKPLCRREAAEARLETVEVFVSNPLVRRELRRELSGVLDLERLLARIALSACSPRELVALKTSLGHLPALRERLEEARAEALAPYLSRWDDLAEIFHLIDRMIVDQPPLNPREGHLIKTGCDPDLDRLKTIARDAGQSIAELEAQERQRTGIPQLKVGYNKIYGYYLEVTKKNLDRVPENYLRKQSLVNAERFVSPELKQLEEEISGAEEKIQAREQELFQQVREQVAGEGARIQAMADVIADLDALAAFAEVAHRHRYCRPVLNEALALEIENGRHPLVESLDPGLTFVPNDTLLDCEDHQIVVLTGPNMAGKSTYLRQVALIVLMAQAGSFVPADRAVIGMVDRIFSRVGAQDRLVKGQSTFMVEMNETANILNNATRNSLIILDEIGRGTSTFDGLSLAWAIVEYLHGPEPVGAKTLFATHYHELTELALLYPGVQNYQVQVKEWNDEIIFLHKIAPGGADRSYGIQVARLAGLPETVLKRAREVLRNHENNEYDAAGIPKRGLSESDPQAPRQLGLFSESASPLVQKLLSIDPDQLTPRQALEALYELVQWVKGGKPGTRPPE